MNSKLWGLIGAAGFCAMAGVIPPAHAQVSALTPEEKSMRGRPGGGPGPNRGTSSANSPKPSSDPRDFAGSYSKMNGAPGGGPGGRGSRGLGIPPGGAGAAGNDDGRTRRYCMPSFSQLGGVEGGVDLLQTKNELTIVGEEMHVIRHIYITDHHDPAAKVSYMGDSIAHWEGNTLVVETTKLKQGGTLIERLSKAPDGTITDAVEQNGPSGGMNRLYWSPGSDPMEWICEDFSDNYMRPDFK